MLPICHSLGHRSNTRQSFMLGSAELGGSRHISWTSRPCWTLRLVINILDISSFLPLTIALWLPKIIMLLSPRVFIRQEGALRQQVGHQASQEAVRFLLFFLLSKLICFLPLISFTDHQWLMAFRFGDMLSICLIPWVCMKRCCRSSPFDLKQLYCPKNIAEGIQYFHIV